MSASDIHTLSELSKGETAVVAGIEGDAALTQRLLALGVLPGQQLRVVGVAPMGDPISVDGPNGRISLRRAEACAIVIDLADGAASTS